MSLFLLIVITLFTILYFKLFVPFLYWKRREIFFVNPWTRLVSVFWGTKSFAEAVRAGYDNYPDRRYYGNYQFLQPSLFVRDLELIKRITIKDFEHFTDHSGLTNEKTDRILALNLFSLKGQKWREMRTTLTPAFTGSKMRAMFGLMQETAQDFVAHFEKEPTSGPLDMRMVFSMYTNDVIASCAFGLKCNSLKHPENEFYQMGAYIATQSPGRVLRSVLYGFFPRLFQFLNIPALPSRISEFFFNLIQATVRNREAQKILRPDMIHLLMEARRGRLQPESALPAIDFTDEVITAQALVFFIAGFTTSSTVLSFLAYELALAPDQQQRLQDEIDILPRIDYEEVHKLKYLDQVVSEALRKYPPGYVLNRICVKDYIIEPETENETRLVLQKGCLVAIPVIALHYNNEFFPNPEEFDPERFSDENKARIPPGTYMPFGSGPRNCIGSRFALLQMKILLVLLLRKFTIVPTTKTKVPLEFAKSLGLEAKGGIWLGLQRRYHRNKN